MPGTMDTVQPPHLRIREEAPGAGWLEACMVNCVFMGAALGLGEPLTHSHVCQYLRGRVSWLHLVLLRFFCLELPVDHGGDKAIVGLYPNLASRNGPLAQRVNLSVAPASLSKL